MKEYAKYIPWLVPIALALTGQPEAAFGLAIFLGFAL